MSKINNSEDIDETSAKEIIEETFSEVEKLIYIIAINKDLLTKDNFAIDDLLLLSMSQAFYQKEEFFNQFRKQFEAIFNRFLNKFVFSFHHLRALLVLPAFKFFFEDENGRPSEITEKLLSFIDSLEGLERKTFFQYLSIIK